MLNVQWSDILIGIIILVAMIEDIKYKSINILVIALFYSAVVLKIMFSSKVELTDVVIGIVVGIGMVLVSIISKQSVGLADSIIILGLGVSYGGVRAVCILTSALCAVLLVAVVLLLFKKVNKKTTIPFIPFIFTMFIFSCF